MCFIIYIYTLTGHFIRYTLLVPEWTPFCLKNCNNYLWHRLNKVFETFLRDFGPYWHDSFTQLLQICQLHIHDALSRSTTSQRCSIGLRSGDCGGHLSEVNSFSCSRNQSEMIWALWRCTILLEVVIRRWVHCSHNNIYQHFIFNKQSNIAFYYYNILQNYMYFKTTYRKLIYKLCDYN